MGRNVKQGEVPSHSLFVTTLSNSLFLPQIALLAGKSSDGGALQGSDMESDGSLRGASAAAGAPASGGKFKGLWRKAFKSTKPKERTRSTTVESDSASSISALSIAPAEKAEASSGDKSPSYKRLVRISVHSLNFWVDNLITRKRSLKFVWQISNNRSPLLV